MVEIATKSFHIRPHVSEPLECGNMPENAKQHHQPAQQGEP